MELIEKKPITTGDQAYAAIQEMVSRGDWIPGQRVSQRRLAKQLGCSTVPVLEAMRRLEGDGLLVTAPHCMAKVRELSITELEGLYLVREGLEAVAARLASTRINDEELDRLRELSDQFDQALATKDRQATCRIDVKLHTLIAEAARCPLLSEELKRFLLLERTAGNVLISVQDVVSEYASHRALVQTLVDHDADAAEYFMKKHIQAGYRDLVDSCRNLT